MAQGSASRRERIWGNNKWNENEGELKRGAGLLRMYRRVTMPKAPYANSHWANWLSEAGPRRVPDAGK
jgi:hypothetical protein